MPFGATWMQLEIIILSEVSQKEKGKYHMIWYDMWNLKYDTNEPIYETGTESCTLRTDWWLPRRGAGWGLGDGWRERVGLAEHRDYIQYPVINHNGNEYFSKGMYICITESLCCTAVTNTTL